MVASCIVCGLISYCAYEKRDYLLMKDEAYHPSNEPFMDVDPAVSAPAANSNQVGLNGTERC